MLNNTYVESHIIGFNIDESNSSLQLLLQKPNKSREVFIFKGVKKMRATDFGMQNIVDDIVIHDPPCDNDCRNICFFLLIGCDKSQADPIFFPVVDNFISEMNKQNLRVMGITSIYGGEIIIAFEHLKIECIEQQMLI